MELPDQIATDSRQPLLEGITFCRTPDVLILESRSELAILSSAVLNGGATHGRHILNFHVDKHYAHPAPAVDLQQRIARLGIDACCTALMTAVRLERVQIVVERELPLAVAVIATVGLGNAMAAGRAGLNGTECREFVPGTINLIVVVDARLSPSARVNAIITATEAKVLALMEAGVMTADGYQASGTSTDAVVVASTERGESCEYAGPCTPIGAMLARAVLTAVRGGLSWDIDKCGR